jgi:microcystin-dependent protein
MALARLENFLKNLRGNTLYVDPNQLDASDSIENRGNSALRPFKTIQRALLEAVRFSYVQGNNNDLFDQTTILISPGTHYIDNRPGHYVSGSIIKNYSGGNSSIPELDLQSNFNITDSDNVLYPYNSAEGGVIVPKGVSLVATDLRKTKIRPLYVPDPTNDLIPRSAIFRVTGGCYIFGFSILDGDPNGNVYYNPASVTKVVPSYSHHKLTAFEYADGKNNLVRVGTNLGKTDLDMYYYKISLGYGNSAGAPVIIDGYDDLQLNIEETRIVGDLGRGSIVIENIYAGDGVNSSNVITVKTASDHGFSPLTSILISGVGSNLQQQAEYNGPFTVAQVISSTEFTYRLTNDPESSLNPGIDSLSNVKSVSDTVSSGSPYVFNCSLKSVYGMNGLHADGNKATGFKSIVTAQFTGISLQKDDRAFVIYNDASGSYNDFTFAGENTFLHQNSRSIYNPEWESFHIKASNDAFIQCVSIFAIGYAKQFIADDGGDQSITNSNSNFGAIALSSRGFKDYELAKDNHGFITHIIPPKEISEEEIIVRCLPIDVESTTTRGLSNNYTRIYLDGYDNALDPPKTSFRGYKLGGKLNDTINYTNDGVVYSAIVSPNYKTEVTVTNITSSVFTIDTPLTIGSVTGINTSQAVRIISNDGLLPDGLEHHRLYYINGETNLTTTTFTLSENIFNSTVSDSIVEIKNQIGATSNNLKLVSKVSDRSAGQPASPVQYDTINGQWYVQIISNAAFISAMNGIGAITFYIERALDSREIKDKIYKARYVIPKESIGASAPSIGFILQNSTSGISSALTLPSSSISDIDETRNSNQIIDAWASYSPGFTSYAYVRTKYPHKLFPGCKVNIYDLKSSNEPNPVGLGTGTGFNGSFIVDLVPNDVVFRYQILANPGNITTIDDTAITTWLISNDCNEATFRVPPYTVSEDTNVRSNLPYFTCEKVFNDYQIYGVDTIQEYNYGVSDGVYHLTLNAFKNRPSVFPFNIEDLKLSQSIENLYPTADKDNVVSDPLPTKSVASRKIIGKVDINDLEKSVTKETFSEFIKDFGIGKRVNSITFNSGTGTCTLTTLYNHGLGGIRTLSVTTAGSGFVNGTWYDIPLCGGSGENATAVVTVTSGVVSDVQISNPGSGYSVGNSLTIRGIPHSSTSAASANVSVNAILNNTLDSIQIIGSTNPDNDGFFPITSITKDTIVYTNSLGVTESNSNASVIISGSRNTVSSVSGTTDTEITSSSRHSLTAGNKVYFESTNQTFDVLSVVSPTKFKVSGNASSTNSSNFYQIALAPSFRSSDQTLENVSGRHYPLLGDYNYRTSNNSVGEMTLTSSSVNISNTSGLKKGDYVQIDDEILLITLVSGSAINVKRGLFNTAITTHTRNTLVKLLRSIPVELRRNSILRASGHTFEYTGFGPGNYSTGMPTNQDRVLSTDETLISQALSTRGGTVLYTGMNSDGEFFIGKKKINALTGDEEFVGIPEGVSGDQTTFDDLTVSNLTVLVSLNAVSAETTLGETIITENLEVLGDAGTTNLFASGIVTATSVIANDLTVITDADIQGSLNVDLNLTVSGHTDLDNVTAGIVTATEFIGRGITPKGGIILWSGSTSSAEALQPNWALCDGRTVNGVTTPNLTNKFVIVAGSSYPVGSTGGSATVSLNKDNLPAHNHGGGGTSTFTTVENGTHSHGITDPGHRHGYDKLTDKHDAGGDTDEVWRNSEEKNTTNQTTGISINEGGAHTHDVTVSYTINTEGSGIAHDNMPPYYALAYIMRTA